MAGLSTNRIDKTYHIDLPNGSYEGTSPDGKTVTGWGTRFYSDGLGQNENRAGWYKGELVNDSAEEKGTRYTDSLRGEMPAEPDKYEGDFKNNKYNGFGNHPFLPSSLAAFFAPPTPKELAPVCSHPSFSLIV